jgi:hypothetical protein
VFLKNAFDAFVDAKQGAVKTSKEN